MGSRETHYDRKGEHLPTRGAAEQLRLGLPFLLARLVIAAAVRGCFSN